MNVWCVDMTNIDAHYCLCNMTWYIATGWFFYGSIKQKPITIYQEYITFLSYSRKITKVQWFVEVYQLRR